jgi:putative RecB family exonuclease
MEPRTIEKIRKNKPHWSYSAINTYLNICQLQFYFRYIDKAKPECQSVNLPFGRAFHAALSFQALKARNGGELNEHEACELFADYFREEVKAAEEPIACKPEDTRDSLIATGCSMLKVVLNNWSDFYNIIDVAKPFEIAVPGLSRPLVGEWDMLVQEGQDPTIVDWKTSSRRWPDDKAKKDFQTTVYTYAYSKLYGVNPLFRFDVITKTVTPLVESYYTRRTSDDFSRFEFLTGKFEDAVNKGVFLPAEQSFACTDCPFAKRCRNYHKK